MKIVQYILLRKDLENFSTGALIAQACHGSILALETYKHHKDTKTYLQKEFIRNMTTITLGILTEDIEKIKTHFSNYKIDFVEWIEQPENTVTCIALRPIVKEEHAELIKYLRNFKLF